jgi:hypothetical protein
MGEVDAIVFAHIIQQRLECLAGLRGFINHNAF